LALDDEIALFAAIPFFAGFQTEQLRLLAFGTEKRALNPGDLLYREGDGADCGYVLRKGRIAELAPGVAATSDHVAQAKIIHQRGVLIEPMALISPLKRSHTAVCADSADLLRISRALFTRMLGEYPELALLLRDRIGREVAQFVGRLDGVLDNLEAIDRDSDQKS
jgi:CRP-like cAMP-binding protein